MSNMKDSLRFREDVNLNGNKLVMSNHVSGRLIGEVTTETYNRAGKLLFSETDKNDITLPGSIFVLEQIFKRGSQSYRFLHPNEFPIEFNNPNTMKLKVYSHDNDDNTDWNGQTLDSSIIDEYISDEDKPASDILEAAVEEPVTFSNPKLHCGVRHKK